MLLAVRSIQSTRLQRGCQGFVVAGSGCQRGGLKPRSSPRRVAIVIKVGTDLVERGSSLLYLLLVHGIVAYRQLCPSPGARPLPSCDDAPSP